jgi:hypothetical protein
MSEDTRFPQIVINEDSFVSSLVMAKTQHCSSSVRSEDTPLCVTGDEEQDTTISSVTSTAGFCVGLSKLCSVFVFSSKFSTNLPPFTADSSVNLLAYRFHENKQHVPLCLPRRCFSFIRKENCLFLIGFIVKLSAMLL